MHVKALVVVMAQSNDGSVEGFVESANSAAIASLERYVDAYYDFYLPKTESLDDYLTFNGGKVGKCCRLSEFEKFTHEDDIPSFIIDGIIYDKGFLETYGVDWAPVVDEVIQRNKSIDNGKEFQLWMVSAEVCI